MTVVIAFGFAPIAVLRPRRTLVDVAASTSFVLRNLFLKVMQDDIPRDPRPRSVPGRLERFLLDLACEFACYLLIGMLVARCAGGRS